MTVLTTHVQPLRWLAGALWLLARAYVVLAGLAWAFWTWESITDSTFVWSNSPPPWDLKRLADESWLACPAILFLLPPRWLAERLWLVVLLCLAVTAKLVEWRIRTGAVLPVDGDIVMFILEFYVPPLLAVLMIAIEWRRLRQDDVSAKTNSDPSNLS